MRKFQQQMVRRWPLSHCIKRLIVTCGGSDDEQVYIVLRYVPLHNRHLVLAADLQIDRNPRRHLALQRWSSVLGHPHQVQMDFKYSVRATPVFVIPEVYLARTR